MTPEDKIHDYHQTTISLLQDIRLLLCGLLFNSNRADGSSTPTWKTNGGFQVMEQMKKKLKNQVGKMEEPLPWEPSS